MTTSERQILTEALRFHIEVTYAVDPPSKKTLAKAVVLLARLESGEMV